MILFLFLWTDTDIQGQARTDKGRYGQTRTDKGRQGQILARRGRHEQAGTGKGIDYFNI